jgi:hypothetical protein
MGAESYQSSISRQYHEPVMNNYAPGHDYHCEFHLLIIHSCENGNPECKESKIPAYA